MIPGLGRSPEEGNGSSLQYSCLGNQWTEELGGLQSMGSQRVLHDLVTKQQQASPLHKLYLFLQVIQFLLSLSGWTVK